MCDDRKTVDIIRFHESGRKKLIIANMPWKEAQRWLESPKTRKAGKWFDGFTSSGRINYDCQKGKALYPSHMTIDYLN